METQPRSAIPTAKKTAKKKKKKKKKKTPKPQGSMTPYKPLVVKTGHILSRRMAVKVEECDRYYNDRMRVVDLDTGLPFEVNGRKLIDEFYSADDVQETRKMRITALIETMISAGPKVFTVWYTKKDGSERKLRGRFVSVEPLMGRSMVEDLDEDPDDRLRQVDHRTITKLVIDRVCYELTK